MAGPSGPPGCLTDPRMTRVFFRPGNAGQTEIVLESAVAYDGLPMSSGGAHALGRIAAGDALAAWRRFIDTCTDPSPIEAWFDFPATPGLVIDPKLARLIERQFPMSGQRGRRSVSPGRFEEAVALFESLEPLPINKWGMAPVWLWFTVDFRLRSPNGSLWPGQDPALFGHFQTPTGVVLGASSTRLILQAKRSVGLSLSIPGATDIDLAELVSWVQPALPMKLSPKHWTRWTLTKDKRSYRGEKIVPSSLG